jgi:hypothetical protein
MKKILFFILILIAEKSFAASEADLFMPPNPPGINVQFTPTLANSIQCGSSSATKCKTFQFCLVNTSPCPAGQLVNQTIAIQE